MRLVTAFRQQAAAASCRRMAALIVMIPAITHPQSRQRNVAARK